MNLWQHSLANPIKSADNDRLGVEFMTCSIKRHEIHIKIFKKSVIHIPSERTISLLNPQRINCDFRAIYEILVTTRHVR